MRVTVIPIITSALGTIPKGLKRENRRMNRVYPNYSIIKISQITEMSPEDPRRQAVIQNPVKDHRLTM